VRPLQSRWSRRVARLAQTGQASKALSGDQRVALTELACRGPSDVDRGITHWSASELRDAFVGYPGGADVSARTIGRALAEANLKPHRQRYFLTSRDPLFREKRRDIVSLYLRPPPGATVLCLDEKPSIQFTDEVKAWLEVHPRFKFHFTPTHASWLNQVECWFSLIARKAIRRGVFDSKLDLHSELMAYVSHWNGQAHPFNWAYGEKLLEVPVAHANRAA